MTMANGHDILGRVEMLESSVETLEESSHEHDKAIGAIAADISATRKISTAHNKAFETFRDTRFKALEANVSAVKGQAERQEGRLDYLTELGVAIAKAVGIDPRSIHPPRDSLVDQVEAVGDRVETVEKRVAKVARAGRNWGKIAKVGAGIAAALVALAAAVSQLASALSGH